MRFGVTTDEEFRLLWVLGSIIFEDLFAAEDYNDLVAQYEILDFGW
jgi:hypothetical protein